MQQIPVAGAQHRLSMLPGCGCYKCTLCGFRGFWFGGPHCGPGADQDVTPKACAICNPPPPDTTPASSSAPQPASAPAGEGRAKVPLAAYTRLALAFDKFTEEERGLIAEALADLLVTKREALATVRAELPNHGFQPADFGIPTIELMGLAI